MDLKVLSPQELYKQDSVLNRVGMALDPLMTMVNNMMQQSEDLENRGEKVKSVAVGVGAIALAIPTVAVLANAWLVDNAYMLAATPPRSSKS